MSDVVFWGATGQARVLMELLEDSGHRLIALFDNRSVTSPFPGIPLFVGKRGFEAWLDSQVQDSNLKACVAIGGSRGLERLELQNWLHHRGIPPMTVIHRTAFVAQNAQLGAGSQILAQSAVCANSRLGASVIVNTCASVDHCCIIGDGSHIGPGAHLAGDVTLEQNVFIGAGATVLPGLHLGKDSVVGGGAVVTRNVPSGHTVFGNPARTRRPPEPTP